jgi:hypothetical protein
MDELISSCCACGSTSGNVRCRPGQGKAKYCDDCSAVFSQECREMSVALPEDLDAQIETMSNSRAPDILITDETPIEAALDGVTGVTDEVIQTLRDAGFENKADLRAASPAAYQDIEGIDATLADAIVSHLNERDTDDESGSGNAST